MVKARLLILLGFLLENGFAQYLESRMIGGEKVRNIPAFLCPITQMVDDKVTKFCSGSLISKKFVLTSALCVEGGNPKNTFVRCGPEALTTDPSKSPGIAKIFNHPGFDRTGKNLIAVIKLKNEIPNLKPINLSELSVKSGAKVTALGWNEDQLELLNLNVLNMAGCERIFPEIKKFEDLDNIICTYGGRGQDMCKIDFGGPLIDSKTQLLVGVSNDVLLLISEHGHEHDCDVDHDHPLFFTKVNPFIPWIKEIMKSS